MNQKSSYLKEREHGILQTPTVAEPNEGQSKSYKETAKKEDKKKHILSVRLLAFLSSSRRNQRSEEEVILPHYLSHLFQKSSYIPRNIKHIFKGDSLCRINQL
jgi:hypothetical protein